MKIPYMVCPECECQILNCVREDGEFHFICECGVEIWYDGEEE